MASNIEFRAKILNCRFSSETFKIYTSEVNNKMYPQIKSNNKNEFILVGNIPSLIVGVEYDIKAIIEVNKTYGAQYKVISVRRDLPTSADSTKIFLKEILTDKQADVLFEVYPDIIDRVVKNNLSDINLNKLSGIGEPTFEKIKAKIVENFCLIDLVDKFGGLIDMSIIKRLYDRYGNVRTIEKQLKTNPYKCLCDLSRVGFKTADSILLNIEKLNNEEPDKYKFKFDFELKVSVKRMMSCLDYILRENESSGNTKMTLKDARQNCGKLVPECIHLFVPVIKDNSDTIVVNMDSKTISTKTAYDAELKIAKFIKCMLNSTNKWNINTEIYREVNRMVMTDEQMGTLNMMCDNSIGILTAPGGSGKSASVQSFIQMADDNNKTYTLMTPTGASSKVLGDYVNRECGTIHRQLHYKPTNEDGSPWGYNENNKLDTDIIIIDEFSMVDIFLLGHVIDAIDINRTKLLLVFDPYQLPSVSCGNIAQDLLSSGKIPTTVLTKIFRYAEGGLMNVVTKIRNSEKFLENTHKGNSVFGTNKDFVYSELNQELIPKQVLNIYKKLLSDEYGLQDIMILSAQNKGDFGTKAINKHIQSFVQRGKGNKFVMRGIDKFFKGDKVIQVVNNYKAKNIHDNEVSVFNGNTGVVVEVYFKEIHIEFDCGVVVYDKDSLSQIELGYCISIHKSQGDSAKQIIVISPKAHTFMLNSNLLYVAGTRAKERVFMIGNIQTINSAIKKKENFSRSTWLQNMLVN